jgi:hypothetical protein
LVCVCECQLDRFMSGSMGSRCSICFMSETENGGYEVRLLRNISGERVGLTHTRTHMLIHTYVSSHTYTNPHHSHIHPPTPTQTHSRPCVCIIIYYAGTYACSHILASRRYILLWCTLVYVVIPCVCVCVCVCVYALVCARVSACMSVCE